MSEPVYTSRSYLRASTDGLNGSGKTCTMAQLAVGLAKEYGDGRPVHVFDSSDRWPAWKIHIFDVEKIPLVITASRSIAGLQESITRAVDAKCAVFVGDDLTVPWMEGVKTFAYENGNLPFDRRQQLVNEWDRFVAPFQLGEFDSIACGRLGYVWENIEDEDGNEKLHQGDSKFNAGGGQNFGYDCILELEMRRRKRRIMGLLRGKTMMEYVCDVIKDANSIINNQQFVFGDFERGYQKGDYKKVLDAIRPHIEFRRRLPSIPKDHSSSQKLIVGGKTAWAKDQSNRGALLQELDANLEICFGSKQSTQGKMFRNLTLEYLNGFISWSRMEEESVTHDIERNVMVIRALRQRIEAQEIPTDPTSLKALLNLSTEDVLHPGKSLTLFEVMGKKSVEKVNGKKLEATGEFLEAA